MTSIIYRSVEFDEKIIEYEGLTTFKPNLLWGAGGDWYYLGPVAVTEKNPNQHGLIVKANVPDALDEVVDWKPVFLDIEGLKFSTWRGVPRNEDTHVVIGDFFVTGIEKPDAKQTAGIRAIRKDLIGELEPSHLIFEKRIPFAVLTLWNVLAVPLIYIPTGAFVSAASEEPVDSKLGVIRFNAAVQQAE